MSTLHRISIVPIEAFATEYINTIYASLSEKFHSPVNSFHTAKIKEICGEKSKVLYIDESISLVFYQTSIAVIIITKIIDWVENMSSIESELIARNTFHKSIISGDYQPINTLNLRSFKSHIYPSVRVNYVFTFYLIESEGFDKKYQAIMAEPSFIDMDDMISTNLKQSNLNFQLLDIPELEDIDISKNCRTYVTWASLVCTTHKNTGATLGLLIALECRLQMTWNKCFAISAFVDEIFSRERKLKNAEQLFWGFAKALDDAKSVISSTYSSRTDKLFYHMMETSKIGGELSRLDQKVKLVEKFVNQEQQKKAVLYQKTIELLLFITALASVIQLFFSTPLNLFSTEIEIYSLVVLGIIGLIAILAKK